MTGESTQYAFSEYGSSGFGARKQHHTRRSRRGKNGRDDSDTATDDGSGSLTYSAASSVNSGGSNAGQSTDSSFADIMKVLDLEDRDELAALMKKEAFGEYRGKVEKQQAKKEAGSSTVSVASSLAYSTDQSSALGGEALLQIITGGQPSDGFGPDGGGILGDDPNDADTLDIDNNILFAPAEPFAKHKKKKNSKSHKRNRSKSSISKEESAMPVGTPTQKEKRQEETSSRDSRDNTPTPASPPSSSSRVVEDDETQRGWWDRRWMCGFADFADAWRDLTPKF